MSEVKTIALDKLNVEMNKPHSGAVDKIHNWICDQDDEDLFNGILKDGKSLNAAVQHLMNEASKLPRQGNMAMLTDEEAYGHIVYYFKNDIKVEVKAQAKMTTAPAQPETAETQKIEKPAEINVSKVEKPKKQEKKLEYGLTSIFDFLNEPEAKTQSEIIAEIKAEAKANAWEDEVNEGDGEVTEDAE